jgi:hypothetical protein
VFAVLQSTRNLNGTSQGAGVEVQLIISSSVDIIRSKKKSKVDFSTKANSSNVRDFPAVKNTVTILLLLFKSLFRQCFYPAFYSERRLFSGLLLTGGICYKLFENYMYQAQRACAPHSPLRARANSGGCTR